MPAFRSRSCLANGSALLALAVGCVQPSHRDRDDDAGADPGPCADGATRCRADEWQSCVFGEWVGRANCESAAACDPGAGCITCAPGQRVCVGNQVRECNPDGTVGEVLDSCVESSACIDGRCQAYDRCEAAASANSYIGCEYWPIDLAGSIAVWGPPYDPGSCDRYRIFDRDGNIGYGLAGPGIVMRVLDVCTAYTSGGNPVTAGLCDYGFDCSEAPSAFSCRLEPVCVNDGQFAPYAVAVANVDRDEPAYVVLEAADGSVASASVEPGQIAVLEPQSRGLPDQSLEFSGIERSAYRLTSDIPVVAYQFNPLDDVDVFSNEASLLLPAHSFGTRYVVLGHPTLRRRPFYPYPNDYNAHVTVVGNGAGPTRVSVTPTAPIRHGDRVGDLVAGQTYEFTIADFDVLDLEVRSGDPTGTVVTSDRPVGVFVSHESAVVGDPGLGDRCCADHLEEQLFPVRAWGKRYAVVRSQSRRRGESDLVRVIAREPDTQVLIDPPVASCSALSPGQVCSFALSSSQPAVLVTADQPILVAHYLTSIIPLDVTADELRPDDGDPAMSYAVPTEQYRSDYMFLVPDKYRANYASIVAPAGASVVLDGIEVSAQLLPFGTEGWAAGRVPLQPGQHEAQCPDFCGIEIYGWSGAVSYMYSAGLDLRAPDLE